MNIVCAICRDHLTESDNISFTRCGHVFHSNCLMRWLTSSDSCPECRQKTSYNKINRLYITFSNNQNNSDNIDGMSVQERIDNLKFQITLNEQNTKYYIAKNKILEKQNAGLRQEVRKVESEINVKNSTIYTLREQLTSFQEKYVKYTALRNKLSRKEKEVEELKRIRTLLYGSLKDVKEVVDQTTDRDTLLTYISTMKKDMSRITNEKKLLRTHLEELRDWFTDLTAEIKILTEEEPKRSEIEQHLANKECFLQRRVNEMRKLFNVSSEEDNVANSSNHIQFKENSLIDVSKMKTTSTKSNTGQETENHNNLSTLKRENKTVIKADMDKYPVHKKRVKLSHSHRNSDEAEVPKKHDKSTVKINTQSTYKQSKTIYNTQSKINVELTSKPTINLESINTSINFTFT